MQKVNTVKGSKATKEVSEKKPTQQNEQAKETKGKKKFYKNFRKPFVVEVVLTEDATSLQIPERKTLGSAGADLKTLTDITIPAHGILPKVRTGIKIKIPTSGVVGFITPRSGMAAEGVIITNSPGEIDSDYRGEIMINFANLSDTDKTYKAGDRVAQLTFVGIRKGSFNLVPEFSPDKINQRGEGGFGSTGMEGSVPTDENKVEDNNESDGSEGHISMVNTEDSPEERDELNPNPSEAVKEAHESNDALSETEATQ